MNVLKKRFVPLVLACVLVMGLAAPAFASKYTVVDGNYVQPSIEVVVPTTARAFINPYALPIKLSLLLDESTPPDATEGSTARPGHTASAGSILNQQIVTEPMFITNKSEVNLAITANVKASYPMHMDDSSPSKLVKSTDMNFVTAPIQSGDASKSVFAYLQMKTASDLNAESSAGDMVAAFTSWTDDSYNANKDLIVNTSTNGNNKGSMVVLKAGEVTGGDASGGNAEQREATNGSIAMFRIAGQVVTEPSKGWDAAKDSFTIKIAFTFKPDTIKGSVRATTPSGAKAIEASGGTIALTASLTGAPAYDNDEKSKNYNPGVTTSLTGVDWAVTAGTGTYVSLVKSGTNNTTCTVKALPAAAGQTEDITVTATITASNGITYTANYTIALKVPSA